jgi:hypothetical protein
VRRRRRTPLGVVSGLIWGLGVVVVVQQLGWRPFDPVLVYGVPAVTAILGGLRGSRRHHRRGTAALFIVLPAILLAQAEPCDVVVFGFGEGEVRLIGRGIDDPVLIPGDFEAIGVAVNVDGEGDGVVWVEVGGIRIPVLDDYFEGRGSVEVSREDMGALRAPGLYHVGGSVEGICSGSGYILIEGSPLDNLIGQIAIGAVIVGLLGTWLAGRGPWEGPRGDTGEKESEIRDSEQPPTLHAGTPIRPPRLRAKVFDEVTLQGLDNFVAGRSHVIEVDVAPPDPTWEAFSRAVMPTGGPWRVVLTEPTIASPQLKMVGASPTGESIRFRLDVPPGTTEIDARLIALAGNRILHTVRLPSTVSAGQDVLTETRPNPNVATAETTVSTGPGTEARPMDAALLVNHLGGTSHLTGVAADGAAMVEVGSGDVGEAVEKIRRRLNEIVEQPEEFADLSDRGTVELLIFLAHHGRLMRNALVADFLGGRLASATDLQVVSATPDAYFPFEFAYDFPAPDENAQLCPEAPATLMDPQPSAPCPGQHTPRTVCPLGFWGLTRLIERHAFQSGEELPAGFLVRSVPRQTRHRLPAGSVLLAASERVDAVNPGTIRRLLDSLTQTTGGHTNEVGGWEQWITSVASGPALTVLLPHTVYSETLDTYGLEIGASDRRWAGDIDARFVPPQERPVITVLLGCETAAAGRVSYERFPGLFRRAGAEVVFATLTEILGRHGAPIADALGAQIVAGWHSPAIRFGEVMLGLRRRLLAQGLPAVLAVVAYGDADWELGGDWPRDPVSG